MHKVEFRVLRNQYSVAVVAPHVEGTSLIELIEAFENKQGWGPAENSYDGIRVDRGFRRIMRQHYLGELDYSSDDKGPRTALLACQCMEIYCWPLLCAVDVDKSTVTWRQFEQPFRDERNYSAFGPFCFDCDGYHAAIGAI